MYNSHDPALRVAILNGVINAVLAIIKLTVGALTFSSALISDGIHSVTDVISTVIVMIGIGFSKRRDDAGHPYGHERMECVAAVVLSVVIAVTGVGIGITGVTAIVTATFGTTIGGAALWASVTAIIVKEGMFRYTRFYARKTHSAALEADAWHQRVDALSSFGSLIGIVGTWSGMPLLDPLASVLIGLLIIHAAITIFADAMRKMTDRACDPALEAVITQTVMRCDGVETIEDLKTRLFGNRVYAEITVTVVRDMTAEQAYRIVLQIRSSVTAALPIVKACSVHIHPL